MDGARAKDVRTTSITAVARDARHASVVPMNDNANLQMCC